MDIDARQLAHADDPATSHAAARASKLRKNSNRRLVLEWVAIWGPASTAELNIWQPELGLTELRRRATDLLNLGLVERLDRTDGRRRPGHLLVITDEGRRALEDSA